MPYSDRDPLPDWYRSSGARRANASADKDGAIWQPDFSDPLYLKYWGELVAAAGERYDGNPILDSVDISSVGYWARLEQLYAGLPVSKAAHRHMAAGVSAYNAADELRRTGGAGLRHSARAGWRLDCLGDMKANDSEMLDQYPEEVARTGIQDVWKQRPVSLETCGTPSTWLRDGYDVTYILEQALRWHVTSVNVKSSPIPTQWQSQFADFEKRMGYRLILRRLEYPARVTVAP